MTLTGKATWSLVMILGLALTGGAGCQTEVKHKSLAHTEKLEPIESDSVRRLHTYQGVFLASQPRQADLEWAAQGGVKTVINLRLPDEVKDFDEQEIVTNLGMSYYNPGFDGPAMLTDAVFDQVRDLLANPAKKPVLLHCSSANRVGAIWLAHRVLDGGLSYEDALAEAKIVGLTLPAYQDKAISYIERRTSRRP